MLRLLHLFTWVLILWGCSGKEIYTGAIELARYDANFKHHTLKLKELGPISYLDNEAFGKEVLLFIHGFHGNKDNWNDIASYLSSSFRLIAIDLPSQGDNPPIVARDFSLNAQSHMLASIIKALKLKPFVLIGHSMGGGIALNYALKYPHKLKALILIASSGDLSHPSLLQKRIERGEKNPLLDICTAKDYEELLAVSMSSVPYIPQSVYDYLAKKECKRKSLYQKIFEDILSDMQMGEAPRSILLPTLIIWGKEDQVISYKDGLAFHEKIPKSNLLILKHSGHIPQLEEPEAVAQEIKRFLTTFGLE